MDAPRKRLAKDYQFGARIGEGLYLTVYLAVDIHLKKTYAIKILLKRHIVKEDKIKYVNIEKTTLHRLGQQHPGIVQLFYTFQDDLLLFFVLDFAEYGELLLIIRKLGSLLEPLLKFYMCQIIDAVKFIHSKGVIHRDLKPENILVGADFNLKITDFGAAKLVEGEGSDDDDTNYDSVLMPQPPNSPRNRRGSFVGTAEYVAPELLKANECGFESDVWAIGCILYQFFCGTPAFKADTEYLTFEKIIACDYTYTVQPPQDVQMLIDNILVGDITTRFTIDQIEAALWFGDVKWEPNYIWGRKVPRFESYATHPTLPYVPTIKTGRNVNKLSSYHALHSQIKQSDIYVPQVGKKWQQQQRPYLKIPHTLPQQQQQQQQQSQQQPQPQMAPPPQMALPPQMAPMLLPQAAAMASSQHPSTQQSPQQVQQPPTASMAAAIAGQQQGIRARQYSGSGQHQQQPRFGGPMPPPNRYMMPSPQAGGPPPPFKIPSQPQGYAPKPFVSHRPNPHHSQSTTKIPPPLNQNTTKIAPSPAALAAAEASKPSSQQLGQPNATATPPPSTKAPVSQPNKKVALKPKSPPILTITYEEVQGLLDPGEHILKLDTIYKSHLDNKVIQRDPNVDLDDVTIDKLVGKYEKLLVKTQIPVVGIVSDRARVFFIDAKLNVILVDLKANLGADYSMYDYDFEPVAEDDDLLGEGFLILELIKEGGDLVFLQRETVANKLQLLLMSSQPVKVVDGGKRVVIGKKFSWIECLLMAKEMVARDTLALTLNQARKAGMSGGRPITPPLKSPLSTAGPSSPLSQSLKKRGVFGKRKKTKTKTKPPPAPRPPVRSTPSPSNGVAAGAAGAAAAAAAAHK